MSDEDDYMSSKFVDSLEKCVAPSLVYRHSDRRELNKLKKRTEMIEKNKPARLKEAEKREEGMSSAIGKDNKGFEMLVKMGYKPGLGIGKEKSGISEPISVDHKTDRLGLGKKRKLVKKMIDSKTKCESQSTDDYRVRMAQKREEQLVQVDLFKSQKACEQLDVTENVEKPRETWFWHSNTLKKDEEENAEVESEEEEEPEPPLGTKLQIITDYLRQRHCYCIWCGAKFEDDDDIKDNCPGSARNDH